MSRTRVFLLTPYTGGNLGDQAIISCLIQNLRARRASIAIVGLTLRPDATAAVHTIPCFPLSARVAKEMGQTRLYEAVSVRATTPPTQKESNNTAADSRIRAALQRIPFVTPVVRAARRTRRIAEFVLQEIVFTPKAARLLGKGDLLIVAGGGQIHDEWGGAWVQPFSLWRWTILARMKGCRVAVASVGWGDLPGRLSRFFIRASLKRACYRSFRDVQSQSTARALGLPATDPCVPDSALALPVSAAGFDKTKAIARIVGLSPIVFGRPGSWPTKDPATYARYIDELSRFASTLTRKGKKVTLFTTSSMDRFAVEDVLAAMRRISETSTDLVTVAKTTTLDELFDVLRTLDLAVVSRLHGTILAHRMGIPTLAISFHRKVDAHMSQAGQSEFCLDIRSVTESDLLQRFDILATRALEIREGLNTFVATCQQPLRRQFDILATLSDEGP